MNISKLSVHNFITDLVRIFNTNFEEVVNEIKTFFDRDNDRLKATNLTITGKIDTNSIYARNIVIVLDDGKKITMNELIRRIEELERKN